MAVVEIIGWHSHLRRSSAVSVGKILFKENGSRTEDLFSEGKGPYMSAHTIAGKFGGTE